MQNALFFFSTDHIGTISENTMKFSIYNMINNLICWTLDIAVLLSIFLFGIYRPYPVQFGSLAQSRLTHCYPMKCSTSGLPVHHQLLEPAQIHVHWVGDATQLSHPLQSPSPPALNLSQHQGLFKWVSPLHQVDKVLGFQLQHQSFKWTPRTNLL